MPVKNLNGANYRTKKKVKSIFPAQTAIRQIGTFGRSSTNGSSTSWSYSTRHSQHASSNLMPRRLVFLTHSTLQTISGGVCPKSIRTVSTTFLPHMRSDMLTGSGPSPRPGGRAGLSRPSAATAAYVRHRRVTGRLPNPCGTWRHQSILLAIRPPWRDVPRTPHAPFLSSPMCRPSAHSRPRSGSSFTKTPFVLFETYSMMGIVSSVRPSSSQ